MTPLAPGRVSVVIPCYRVAHLVPRTLESVLAQTYADVEIIVVDDCSPDALAEALAPYEGRIVVCRHEQNQGVSAARNTGAARASGNILAFLDGDDWWPPDFLERLAPQVGEGRVICYDNVVVPEQQGEPETPTDNCPTLFSEAGWTRTFLDWETMNALFQDAPIFKILIARADFERVGGYDTRFHGIEDFHLCVKMLAHRLRLEMKRTPRGFYLVHSHSFIRTHDRELAKQLQSICEWQTMTRVMPQELTLNEAAAKTCRAAHAYWSARRADLLVRQHVSQRQFEQMLSRDFLQKVVPSLPRVFALKMQSLVRKVQTVLGRARPLS